MELGVRPVVTAETLMQLAAAPELLRVGQKNRELADARKLLAARHRARGGHRARPGMYTGLAGDVWVVGVCALVCVARWCGRGSTQSRTGRRRRARPTT